MLFVLTICFWQMNVEYAYASPVGASMMMNEFCTLPPLIFISSFLFLRTSPINHFLSCGDEKRADLCFIQFNKHKSIVCILKFLFKKLAASSVFFRNTWCGFFEILVRCSENLSYFSKFFMLKILILKKLRKEVK